MVSTLIINIISALVIIGTFLPLLKNKHWIVRSQIHLRPLYLGLNVLLIFIQANFNVTSYLFLIVAIHVLGFVVCAKNIFKFTSLGNTAIDSTNREKRPLTLLIHNVYQYNNQYDKLIECIKDRKPDVFLLLETNEKWFDKVKELDFMYPYMVYEIREDTYGLMMCSKIRPKDAKIKHFYDDSIPSAEMFFNIYGQDLRILGVHPEPPVPNEKTTSKPKDQELIRAATYMDECADDLQIIIGDLNDVAWSKTTKKLKKISGLKDPRKGRGFFGTFPANAPVKIPLDHIFCSEAFELTAYDVLDDMGSDHLAIFVQLEVPIKDKTPSIPIEVTPNLKPSV